MSHKKGNTILIVELQSFARPTALDVIGRPKSLEIHTVRYHGDRRTNPAISLVQHPDLGIAEHDDAAVHIRAVADQIAHVGEDVRWIAKKPHDGLTARTHRSQQHSVVHVDVPDEGTVVADGNGIRTFGEEGLRATRAEHAEPNHALRLGDPGGAPSPNSHLAQTTSRGRECKVLNLHAEGAQLRALRRADAPGQFGVARSAQRHCAGKGGETGQRLQLAALLVGADQQRQPGARERFEKGFIIGGGGLGLKGLAPKYARKEFKPDLTVQAGYMNRGGLDPMWQAGVSVNLPLARGRRKAALAEADAQVAAAEERVHAVELQLRFRTQERLARLESIERTARLYEQGVLPQSRLSVDAGVASYQAGRVPFVTVLEALGSLYTDRGALIRLLTARGQALASIEEASLEATGDMQPLPSVASMPPPATGMRLPEDQTTRAAATAAKAGRAPMSQ